MAHYRRLSQAARTHPAILSASLEHRPSRIRVILPAGVDGTYKPDNRHPQLTDNLIHFIGIFQRPVAQRLPVGAAFLPTTAGFRRRWSSAFDNPPVPFSGTGAVPFKLGVAKHWPVGDGAASSPDLSRFAFGGSLRQRLN